MQRRFRWLLILIVLVCAAWSGAWFYGADYAGKAADKWIAQQAAQGRQWACADREISGYPFRMLIRCKSLHYEGPASGGTLKIKSGPFRAIVQVYNPKLVLAEAEGPVSVTLPGKKGTIEAKWSQLRASLRIARPIPKRVSVLVEKLAVQVALTNGRNETISASNGEFHLRPAPDVTADFGATDVALLFKGASSTSANRLARDEAPIDASIITRITRAPLLVVGPRGDRLEQWRKAKGTLTLQNSQLSKGSVRINASGQLHIDEEHQPAGKISGQVGGIGMALVTRFLGVPDLSKLTGGLLGGLFGKKTNPPAEGQPKKGGIAIPVSVSLRDGKVFVNGIRSKVMLRPLY